MSYQRRLEKILAFAISISVVIWFLWQNDSVSRDGGTGLLLGVMAPFFVTMIGVSAHTEGWMLTAITILIGIRYGMAGLGMSLLGFASFTAVSVAIMALVNSIRSGHVNSKVPPND
jgi:hypothetical protein